MSRENYPKWLNARAQTLADVANAFFADPKGRREDRECGVIRPQTGPFRQHDARARLRRWAESGAGEAMPPYLPDGHADLRASSFSSSC